MASPNSAQGFEMKRVFRITPESVVLGLLLIFSLLGLIFMDSLVAAPKLLFGRSLSSLAPSMFPAIILALLALLCAVALVQVVRSGDAETVSGPNGREWLRGIVFFVLMTGYALTMEPLGFLLSSALAIAFSSVLMGNRSALQIAILSFAAPILLYLAATRLLAVSLPELNMVELAYARLLGE